MPTDESYLVPSGYLVSQSQFFSHVYGLLVVDVAIDKAEDRPTPLEVIILELQLAVHIDLHVTVDRQIRYMFGCRIWVELKSNLLGDFVGKDEAVDMCGTVGLRRLDVVWAKGDWQ